jgi:3-deoxy-D-manno-octulosonic-acid transferase
VAVDKYKDCLVCYWPLDLSWSVRRALKNIQPTQVVLVELELWPNFLLAAHKSGIPVSIVNGRLSEKSYRGYRRLQFILKPLLRTLRFVGAQNRDYARRFCDLGVSTDRVHITGSVKFDHAQSDRQNAQTRSLHSAFALKSGEPVFIAGSTQAPEEELAMTAWLQARTLQPNLRLILVPRHKERFEEVAALVLSKGLPLFRRSTGQCAATASSDIPPVLLLDTLGELSACWGLATYAFVGGSLTRRGGQNMIEPAAYGAAVCFGPDTRNFRDTVESLLAEDAARVVADGRELSALLEQWIRNPLQARQYGERARQFVLTQHGAARKTVDLLCGKPCFTESRAA